MKDKIVLLQYKEAIKKYRQSMPGYTGSAILMIGETEWNYIYNISPRHKFNLESISDIYVNYNEDYNVNLRISIGVLKLWVPAVCVDFSNSRVTDIDSLVKLMNI